MTAVHMKNQVNAMLVQIYRKVCQWGPLAVLAVLALIVPGGSLIALWIVHRQHAHRSVQ